MLDKKRPDAILITFEKDPSPRNVKPLAQHRTLYVLVLLPTTDLSAPLNPNHRSRKALVTYINISSGSPRCTITSWPPKKLSLLVHQKPNQFNMTSMSRGAVAAHVRGNQWAALSSRETGLSGCSLVPGEDGGRPVLPAVTIQHSKHFPILCFLFLYCTTTHTRTSPFRCYKVTLVFHCNTYIYSVFFSHWHPP